jgi:60 kDa SS-A/Ro ribonucleoprotein
MSNLPLSCRDAAAAMAMVIARSEPQYVVTIFSSAGTDFHLARGGWSGSGISTFDISPRERLDDVIRRTSNLDFGGTDCALPILYADDRKLLVDTFVILTDSETWAGNVHPSQALTQYRQKSGRQSRLVVVGMTSNGFSIADPRDAGQLDVVGFDTATPQLISEFSAGNI